MGNINRTMLWILGGALFCAGLWYFSDIVTYILLAWVLSMLGQPLMQFYQKYLRFRKFHIGATGAAILTILSFYGLFLGIILIFAPTIAHQAENLASIDYGALGDKLKGPFQDLDAQMHQLGVLQPTESLATKTQETLKGWFKPTMIGDIFSSLISSAGNFLVTLTSVTFILFFFLQEKDLFTNILHAFVPNGMEEKVIHSVDESSRMLTRYFRALAIQVAYFSTLIFVFLWILGVPNALIIGFFGGMMNVVPYLGPIIGSVFGIFITLSSNLNLEFAVLLPLLLKVAGTFIATQFLDNNILGPLLFSNSVKAHPLEIFLVTIIAAKLGGVGGMVIGIPVYTVLRVIAKVFFSEFKVVQKLTEGLEE